MSNRLRHISQEERSPSVGEYLAAALIVLAPVWASWLFYLVTGHVVRL